MTTVVKKRCTCVGSSIKVFPQTAFLKHYSPNQHAILRYRPDTSKTDAVIRTLVHSSIEKAFWELESPHFLFDAHFEADASGLPIKVKIDFTQYGVHYDVEVYFMKSIVPGSCVPIKRIDTISDIFESATRTFHLYWKCKPKASATDIAAWRQFYHSTSSKDSLAQDLSRYFGIETRSASGFRISRKNAARIFGSRDNIEKHLVVSIVAIKFTSAHLSLVFDFGYKIRSVAYLSNSKAADVLSVLKGRVLDVKSARSDFTMGEISDIVQCAGSNDASTYGRGVGAFLVYSKILELARRSIPCTKATNWLISNGVARYADEDIAQVKTSIADALGNHVNFNEAGDIFCSTDYVKVHLALKQSRTYLLESGTIRDISYATLSPWSTEDYSRFLHLNFETSFVFILSLDAFTFFTKEWPSFTSVKLVTAGEAAISDVKSMSGPVKDVFVIGFETEPISVLGMKMLWISVSLRSSGITNAALRIQTLLPYWRMDDPLKWSMIPAPDSRARNTAEAIQYLECDCTDVKVTTFDSLNQILGTIFSKPIFAVADRKAVTDYVTNLMDSPGSPPLRSSGSRLRMSDNISAAVSVDWEISRHSSEVSQASSSPGQFKAKDFIERHRKDFKTVSEVSRKGTKDCEVFLLCFADKEHHKFYLEEIEHLLSLGVSSITVVLPALPATEKFKAFIKAESHYVSSACSSLVNQILE